MSIKKSLALALALILALSLAMPAFADGTPAGGGGPWAISGLEILPENQLAVATVNAPADSVLTVALYESEGGRMTGTWSTAISGAAGQRAVEVKLGSVENAAYAKAFLTAAGSWEPICEASAQVKSDSGKYDDSNNEIITEQGELTGKTFTNLTIASTVGDGDVTLNNVTVEGTLYVNGGGANSVILKDATVATVQVQKSADAGKEAVRLKLEGETAVTELRLASGGGSKGVTLEVDADATVDSAVVYDGGAGAHDSGADNPEPIKLSGNVNKLSLESHAVLEISGTSSVEELELSEQATGSSVTVEKGGTVTTLNSAAEGAKIEGSGTVTTANISGNNTVVNTDGTEVIVEEGTEGVTQNGEIVPSGPSYAVLLNVHYDPPQNATDKADVYAILLKTDGTVIDVVLDGMTIDITDSIGSIREYGFLQRYLNSDLKEIADNADGGITKYAWTGMYANADNRIVSDVRLNNIKADSIARDIHGLFGGLQNKFFSYRVNDNGKYTLDLVLNQDAGVQNQGEWEKLVRKGRSEINLGSDAETFQANDATTYLYWSSGANRYGVLTGYKNAPDSRMNAEVTVMSGSKLTDAQNNVASLVFITDGEITDSGALYFFPSPAWLAGIPDDPDTPDVNEEGAVYRVLNTRTDKIEEMILSMDAAFHVMSDDTGWYNVITGGGGYPDDYAAFVTYESERSTGTRRAPGAGIYSDGSGTITLGKRDVNAEQDSSLSYTYTCDDNVKVYIVDPNSDYELTLGGKELLSNDINDINDLVFPTSVNQDEKEKAASFIILKVAEPRIEVIEAYEGRPISFEVRFYDNDFASYDCAWTLSENGAQVCREPGNEGDYLALNKNMPFYSNAVAKQDCNYTVNLSLRNVATGVEYSANATTTTAGGAVSPGPGGGETDVGEGGAGPERILLGESHDGAALSELISRSSTRFIAEPSKKVAYRLNGEAASFNEIDMVSDWRGVSVSLYDTYGDGKVDLVEAVVKSVAEISATPVIGRDGKTITMGGTVLGTKETITGYEGLVKGDVVLCWEDADGILHLQKASSVDGRVSAYNDNGSNPTLNINDTTYRLSQLEGVSSSLFFNILADNIGRFYLDDCGYIVAFQKRAEAPNYAALLRVYIGTPGVYLSPVRREVRAKLLQADGSVIDVVLDGMTIDISESMYYIPEDGFLFNYLDGLMEIADYDQFVDDGTTKFAWTGMYANADNQIVSTVRFNNRRADDSTSNIEPLFNGLYNKFFTCRVNASGKYTLDLVLNQDATVQTGAAPVVRSGYSPISLDSRVYYANNATTYLYWVPGDNTYKVATGVSSAPSSKQPAMISVMSSYRFGDQDSNLASIVFITEGEEASGSAPERAPDDTDVYFLIDATPFERIADDGKAGYVYRVLSTATGEVTKIVCAEELQCEPGWCSVAPDGSYVTVTPVDYSSTDLHMAPGVGLYANGQGLITIGKIGADLYNDFDINVTYSCAEDVKVYVIYPEDDNCLDAGGESLLISDINDLVFPVALNSSMMGTAGTIVVLKVPDPKLTAIAALEDRPISFTVEFANNDRSANYGFFWTISENGNMVAGDEEEILRAAGSTDDTVEIYTGYQARRDCDYTVTVYLIDNATGITQILNGRGRTISF